MKTIWITRTQPGADKSAQAWLQAGWRPIIAPLLSASPVQPGVPIPKDAQLIFTSAHAVRQCGLSGDDQRVYTVGDATAQVARDHGFTNVISADGDWQDLLRVIEPTGSPLVHLSGRVIRGALVDALQAQGLTASRIIVYETQPVSDWPVDVTIVHAVALYSPLASQTLMGLSPRSLDHLSAFCLSAAVAEGLVGPRIKIAPRPNESALIACSGATEP